MSKDDLLFNQLKNQNDLYAGMVGNTNPNISQQVKIVPNQQIGSPVGQILNNYVWYHKYFKKDYDTSYPPLRDFTLKFATNISTEEINTSDGNLFVQNIDSSTVHVYSAEIFRFDGIATNLPLVWNGSLSLYLNGHIIASSDNHSFNTKTISIGLESGWNKIDLYLYSSIPNQYFTINNAIGDFANGWRVPYVINNDQILNFSGSVDLSSTSMRDPITNIIRWDNADPSRVYGYNLQRRGPYNSGLSSPLVSQTLSTGYFISGITKVDNFEQGGYPSFFYSISAINSGGESLPSYEKNITFDPFLTGAYLVSGLSVNTPGAALTTGYYSYIVFGETVSLKTSPYGQSVFGFYENTNNSILVSWSGNAHPMITGYSIYRVSGMLQPPQINSSGTKSNMDYYSISGVYIGGTSSSAFSIIDTGKLGPLVTGFDLLPTFWNNGLYGKNVPQSFMNNATYLKWTNVGGATSYNIYRTSYSGIYLKNSLIGNTTGLNYIDSNYYYTSGLAQQGKPTIFENIANIDYGTNKYKDTAISLRQTYDYAIRTYNYDYNLGPQNNIITITAGDSIAPNTPSGITIISLNGFATLGWQNGVEADLAGTIIYDSTDSVTYNEIGRVSAPTNTFTDFVGYSGLNYFKLANYDTSLNISTLSAAQIGSGIMKADNIILSDFVTLSTVDIDMDYYMYSGVGNGSSFRSEIIPIIHPGDYISTRYLTNWLDGGSANTFQSNFIDVDSSLSAWTFSTQQPLKISGISSIAVASTAGDPYGSHLLMSAYYTGLYTGVSSTTGYILHYRAWSAGGGNLYTQIATSTTGIAIGNYFQGRWAPTASTQANPAPVFISHSGNINKNVIVFLSGNQADVLSFGFLALDSTGSKSGNIKYMNLHDVNITNTAGFAPDYSACFDENGYINLVWKGFYTDSTAPNNSLIWYKIDFQNANNNPIIILNSGIYSRSSHGGYLLPNSFNPKYDLYSPRITCDKTNQLNILFKQYGDNGRTVMYSQMDTSGNIRILPNILYQIPFKFDVNSWNTIYGREDDIIYTNYNIVTDPSPWQRNIPYNFKVGSYRRRHEFERYTNASLYQIIQSVLK